MLTSNFWRSKRLFLLLCMLVNLCIIAHAAPVKWANTAPAFLYGGATLAVCTNSTQASISKGLETSDPDNGQTLSWSIVANPKHGTVTGIPVSIVTTGSNISPAAYYTPETGYAGLDSLTLQVSDGTASNTMVLYINMATDQATAISYGQSVFCASGYAPVTTSGITNGEYSGGTGLVVDKGSGLIDLETSLQGTYNVRYVYKGLNCTGTATALVTISAPSKVTIDYAGSPYCPSGAAAVTQTGATGGIYNAASGLDINSETGAINLANSTAGTYVVNYTVIDNNSCLSTTSDTVVVVDLKKVTAISGNTKVCAGATQVYTNGTTGGVWASNNTSIATVNAATGSVTGVTPGYITLSYTITNGSCVSKTDITVYVESFPYVDSIKGNGSICTGSTTQLSNTTVGGSWSTGDATIATVSNTGLVTGVAAGSVTISYSYSNGACSTVVTKEVMVKALPVATISYAGSPYCISGTAMVTLTGVTGGTFSSTTGLSIDAATGTINLAGSTPGTYTVKYQFSNGTCGDATTTSVTVKALPVATVSYIGSPYCATGSAAVYQTGETGGAYSALTGLAINATTGAVNLATSQAGSYTVTYTFGAGTCVNKATTTIVVNTIPALPSITANGALGFCAGGNVVLTSSATANNQWMKNGGAINGATSKTLTVNAAGGYSVTVNNNGCSVVSDLKQVTVYELPTAAITADGSLAICEGSSVKLTSSSNIINQWLLNGAAIAGATSNVFNAGKAGSYGLIVTTTNGCVDTSDNVEVTVNALPELTLSSAAGQLITKGGSTQLTVTSNGAIASTYWTPATSLDNPLSTTPVATPLENTLYTATVTDDKGCEASDTISIQVTEEFKVSARSVITPNGDGVNDQFIIDNVLAYPDNVLSVFDRNGKKLYEKHNYDNSWGGTNNGVLLAADTYMYVFTVQGRVVKKGTVTIVH
ncbi:gliding motility-associated C-terminal domain-containing protein [Filimonas lacunae]|uniref:Gliding motility-associated C-terminal domain-containing protein n=2 Tax=Filimonas lacunae TaxID=477680 RepID=A0A1N7QRH2_9BACT|nr:gliding motility-associated C-terminal domain-containing protein [Filimonas lacunae]SIT25374.1 gliding motility-associated C-terminal domain-containing protein [Filimonas lacunae]